MDASRKDFFINGSIPSLGGVINVVVSGDFSIPGDEYFYINPETVGTFAVQLPDDSTFVVTAVQAAAYLGFWMPLAIKKVYQAGTTGTFSFGY